MEANTTIILNAPSSPATVGRDQHSIFRFDGGWCEVEDWIDGECNKIDDLKRDLAIEHVADMLLNGWTKQ